MCGIIGLLLANEDENVSTARSKLSNAMQCNAMQAEAEEKDGMGWVEMHATKRYGGFLYGSSRCSSRCLSRAFS